MPRPVARQLPPTATLAQVGAAISQEGSLMSWPNAAQMRRSSQSDGLRRVECGSVGIGCGHKWYCWRVCFVGSAVQLSSWQY